MSASMGSYLDNASIMQQHGMIERDDDYPAPTVRYGACSVCRRPLRDPASVDRGMGPICAGKHATSTEHGPDRLQDQYLIIPLSQGLHCIRKDGLVFTNIPHIVTHHSPDGFEFGYGGSGPADLALNAVEAFLRSYGWTGRKHDFPGSPFNGLFEITVNHYQDFKRQFVARLDQDKGGHVPAQRIFDYLGQFMTVELRESEGI